MSANKTIDIEEEEDDCPLNAACSSNSMESSTSNNESNEDIPNVQQCKVGLIIVLHSYIDEIYFIVRSCIVGNFGALGLFQLIELAIFCFSY